MFGFYTDFRSKVTSMVIVKTLNERYNNYTCSFINKPSEKSTELPKYVWELNERHTNFINWDIAMKSQYVSGSRKCDLCFCEKLLIV